MKPGLLGANLFVCVCVCLKVIVQHHQIITAAQSLSLNTQLSHVWAHFNESLRPDAEPRLTDLQSVSVASCLLLHRHWRRKKIN